MVGVDDVGLFASVVEDRNDVVAAVGQGLPYLDLASLEAANQAEDSPGLSVGADRDPCERSRPLM
jgi:hypothetical protein